MDALIDNVDVGLRIPVDSQAFCQFLLCSAPPWASVALQSFMALYFITFLYSLLTEIRRPKSVDTLQQRPWSVLNFLDGGASTSMLITLRSFPVITIRPNEADDSSFRILGRNAILFVCFRGKTPDLTFTPFQLELAWPWLSFLCWKSDLPECPDDFFSFSQHQFHEYQSHGTGA